MIFGKILRFTKILLNFGKISGFFKIKKINLKIHNIVRILNYLNYYRFNLKILFIY